ncbi:uncharacterized protein LOC115924807 [Strongylocentrotus purpuratus]|uniref:Fibronectin type-III domain-containing protein n=1 Tax=Strongylocentrotus purpuratus TaxID=7668 RepID=A0A7M7NYP0_STRPU|nr:uncharacterized protein LOC115924807 [Strongylocentrotus purpuratus]
MDRGKLPNRLLPLLLYRLQSAREKTNPDIAIFSCVISLDSPTNYEPDFVKATTEDFSIDNWKTAKGPPQIFSSTLLNFIFNIQDFSDDSPIYCFIGDPFNKSSEFGYIRLASAAFYVLPSFSGVPELLELGYHHAAIGWRQWDSSSETGDGPIVGYKIYVRSGSNAVLAKEVPPPSMVPITDRSVLKRSAENANEMVMYNVSGLEAGSTYSVQIAAIRDGINGEGEQGPALTFTTKQGWHLKEMKCKIRVI